MKMDSSQLEDADLRLFVPEISSRTVDRGEAGIYDGGKVETKGSPGSSVDLVDLSTNVAFNIVKEKTTSGLLKALSNMYEKSSAMNKVYLMRRLLNLQMSENGSASDHINEFNMIASQLSSLDINFKGEIKALILMSSLPESWDAFVAAISSSRGSEKPK